MTPYVSTEDATQPVPFKAPVALGAPQSTDNKSIEHALDSINDKLSKLQSMDEEHIKRLDSIELRINRVQAANHEKTENIRSELRNFVSQFESIASVINNIDSSINQMKLSANDGTISSDSHKLKSRSVPSEDFDQKLDALATLLTSTRSAVARVEKGVAQLQGNFTQLQASTKTIHHLQRQIPTKHFLNNILQHTRSQILLTNSDNSFATSCNDIDDPQTGIYQIQVHNGMKPFYVRCEETSEDKWTVILSRFNGATTFYRNWVEYKNGFGNIATEFWIGLDKLYEITNSKLHELYIVLEDFDGVTKHARYSQFSIGSEKEDYPLNVLGEYSGTAGDSLSYHAGSKFSTFDVDNDVWLEGNCAQYIFMCDLLPSRGHRLLGIIVIIWGSQRDVEQENPKKSRMFENNLNGKYFNGTVSEMARFQGIYWNDFHGPTYSLRAVKMLIKAIQY